MTSLSTHSQILGKRNARHLLRRSTFVYTKQLVDQYALLTPEQALDLLFTETPLIVPKPYDYEVDGYWTDATSFTTGTDNRKRDYVSGWWWYNAINTPNLKFKLSLFLSTRFTVEKNNNAGGPSEFYDHIRIMLYHAFGNYKKFAFKMCWDNSMLQYLNNTQNTKNSPNENYAREFLELFTIGKGAQIANGDYTTYTEVDVVQAAKVFTGIKRANNRLTIDSDTNIPRGTNNFSQHDTSTKVFSKAFGNKSIAPAANAAGMFTEVQAFVDLVFSQLNTAKNIVRKLYRFFVKGNITPEVENDIITPLANDLFANGYEIMPVLRKLLTSLHFYDLDDSNSNDENIGAMIKSPVNLISEFCTYLNAKIPVPESTTTETGFYKQFYRNFVMGTFLQGSNMNLFDPDSVAGHVAYYQFPDFDKAWIASSTIISRYKLPDSLLDGKNRILNNNANIVGKINISEAIRDTNIVNVKDDPFALTKELCDALFAQEPNTDRINYFMNTFLLQGIDIYNWYDAWSDYILSGNNSVVEPRLKLLLLNIMRAPETQVF